MSVLKRALGLAVLMAAMVPGLAWSQAGRPLTEENVAKLVELQIDGDAIASRIGKAGIAFPADAAALARLKQAGAPDAVLESVRKAGAAQPAAAAGKAITYQDILSLLDLGVGEPEILRRLEKSPTLFTLDAAQVGELKRAGASDALLAALQGVRARLAQAPAITDLAIVLDCSGSMAERTRDGQAKMTVAKQVVADLLAKLPDKLRVTLIIYGHDRALGCRAVKVARPLGELDAAGRSELAGLVAGLKPVGGTPIALALEVAGAELAKDDAPCGLVLISDGKETCGGNPAEVAAALAGRMKLTFGVNVVGFDVRDDERAALAEIARAGRGKYRDARSARELAEAARGLQEELEVVARPAPTAKVLKLGAARVVKVAPPAIELPPLEGLYLSPAGTDRMALRVDSVAKGPAYNRDLRIPATTKATTFDLWWEPRQGRSVAILKGFAVDEPVLVVKPEEHLGLVRVAGKDLPETSLILLTPVGTADFATRADAVQSTDGYGKAMVVPAGTYDLWIEPAGGGKSERLAERLEVAAGKVTAVE